MAVNPGAVLGALGQLQQTNANNAQLAYTRQQQRAQGIGQITGLLGAVAGGVIGAPAGMALPGAGLGMALGQSIGTAGAGGPPMQPTQIAGMGMQAYGLVNQQRQQQAQGSLGPMMASQAKTGLDQQAAQYKGMLDQVGGLEPDDPRQAAVPQIQEGLKQVQARQKMLDTATDPNVVRFMSPEALGVLQNELSPQMHTMAPGAGLYGGTKFGGMGMLQAPGGWKIIPRGDPAGQGKAIGLDPSFTWRISPSGEPEQIPDRMQNISGPSLRNWRLALDMAAKSGLSGDMQSSAANDLFMAYERSDAEKQGSGIGPAGIPITFPGTDIPGQTKSVLKDYNVKDFGFLEGGQANQPAVGSLTTGGGAAGGFVPRPAPGTGTAGSSSRPPTGPVHPIAPTEEAKDTENNIRMLDQLGRFASTGGYAGSAEMAPLMSRIYAVTGQSGFAPAGMLERQQIEANLIRLGTEIFGKRITNFDLGKIDQMLPHTGLADDVNKIRINNLSTILQQSIRNDVARYRQRGEQVSPQIEDYAKKMGVDTAQIKATDEHQIIDGRNITDRDGMKKFNIKQGDLYIAPDNKLHTWTE